MADRFAVRDMGDALRERRFPTVTVWNRLEGRPRTHAFDRALRAEVRDALWMLSRQWQLGEFRGDDAGSPFFAKLHVTHAPLTRYRADDGAAEPFEPNVPLEATVERRPLPLMVGGRETALDLRLAMGRQWLKLIAPIGDYRQAFADAYAIPAPDPTALSDAHRVAHPEVWQTVAAVAGRRMDGGRLYLYLLADPDNRAYDGVIGIAGADKDAIDEQAARFLRWCRRLLAQPDADDAWVSERLEYRFAVGDGETVLTAEEYPGGTLDWHSFDVDREASLGTTPVAPPAATTRTLVPVPLEFEGMPDSRWWAFEDRRTNFGAIDAATTDLAKLLFVEFGLVYANDWFLVPCALPVGGVATVEGVAVTNVFGERTWIEPAGTGSDDGWQRWSMFTLSVAGTGPQEAERSLLLAPTVPKIQESSPVEEVLLVRDEMANMVWGVEIVVPTADGGSKRGAEAATEMLAFYARALAARPGGTTTSALEPVAPVRYEVMTGVPEHWIPFLPVHVEGSTRETQLQRAAMPRILAGDPDPPRKVRPRTTLLRHGLDAAPPSPYLVHEEEVPRAGARVLQAWQRTRWRDGSVHVWLGARRQTGRGEHSSGLAFDQALDGGLY